MPRIPGYRRMTKREIDKEYRALEGMRKYGAQIMCKIEGCDSMVGNEPHRTGGHTIG